MGTVNFLKEVLPNFRKWKFQPIAFHRGGAQRSMVGPFLHLLYMPSLALLYDVCMLYV